MFSSQMRRFQFVLLGTLTAALAGSLCARAQQPPPRRIVADITSTSGPVDQFFDLSVGSDYPGTLIRDDSQAQLKLAVDELGFRYIRFHAIFHDVLGTVKVENGKTVYDWTKIDQLYDDLLARHIKPFVELGFTPDALATSQNSIFYWHGNTSHPKPDGWHDLVDAFIRHIEERYGRDEVRTWYFEVWNEPDIVYWHGTPQEYFKLYDYAVAGVRTALPNAKVGGPASTGPAGPKSTAFLQSFLEHCAHGKSTANGKPIPLDFISFHPKGNTIMANGHVQMGISGELEAAQNGFRLVAAFPRYRRLPIILSEADPEGCAACSVKDNPAKAYRNGPLYASYTATAIKALFELQDEAKVNLIAMLSWSFEFENKNYFEGFRTLATNGIDKPILNLFRMAGLMSGERVATASTDEVSLADLVKTGVHQAPDVDAFATRADHEAAVMLWNYHDDDLPAPSADVQITVSGIPAGVNKVLFEHYRIDDTHSNAYTAWKNMGSPQSPTPEQYAELKAAGQLQLLSSPAWLDVDDGKVTIDSSLPRQAVSLLRLKW